MQCYFNNRMLAQVNAVQNNADDINYFVNEAKNSTVIPFST